MHEKNFSEDRVRKTIARIVANKGKANQGRLESFFSVVPKAAPAAGAAKDAKGELCVQRVWRVRAGSRGPDYVASLLEHVLTSKLDAIPYFDAVTLPSAGSLSA